MIHCTDLGTYGHLLCGGCLLWLVSGQAIILILAPWNVSLRRLLIKAPSTVITLYIICSAVHEHFHSIE